jgi:hypothetical protein
MRRSVILSAVVICLICMILSAAAPALAESPQGKLRTGSVNVGVNDHRIIGEFISDQDSAYTPVISYTIYVIGDNGPVFYDVLLMDEANYSKYNHNQAFGYISEGSKISQSAQSVTVSNLPLAQHTHYYLVLDNSNLPPAGSTPTQELRAGYVVNTYNMSIITSNEIALAVIFLVIIVIVLIALAAILVYLLVRRKPSNQPAMPTAPIGPEIKPATPEGNCPVCGKPVQPDFYLCPNCGNRLK